MNNDSTWLYNDGGRFEAGFKGDAGDCVCRSIAIAAELPYKEVYEFLANGNATQRVTKRTKRTTAGKKTARSGIYVKRKWFKDYMESLGFKWKATMGIGTGCQVHAKANELPSGNIILALSKHYAAMIDGVIQDTHDCTRNGTRCVYGYWYK